MHVHGDNLRQKEMHKAKYTATECKECLTVIRERYDKWQAANEKLIGPASVPQEKDTAIIGQRVKLFSDYKEFIDQEQYAVMFDSRSNLHSSVLEEFVFYLFRDLVREFSENAVIGKAHTFKDMFFLPKSFKSMVEIPSVRIEKKDHDFVIGTTISARFSVSGAEKYEEASLQVPAVAIECKTYLDKTMLEGSSAAAEQLKVRNPNAIYIVVCEWLKLTEAINLKKYKVDQIYVLRKQKNTDREYRYLEGYVKNPVYPDVVAHLFNYVRSYLTADWESGVNFGLEKGFLL